MSTSDIRVKIHMDFGKTFSYTTEDREGEGEGLAATIDLMASGLGRVGQFISVTVEDGTKQIINRDRIAYVEVSQEDAE